MQDTTQITDFLRALLTPIIKPIISEEIRENFRVLQQTEPEPDIIDTIDIIEAAKETRYKVNYLYQLCSEGRIPFDQVAPGCAITFSRKKLKVWRANGGPQMLSQTITQLSQDFLKGKKKRSSKK